MLQKVTKQYLQITKRKRVTVVQQWRVFICSFPKSWLGRGEIIWSKNGKALKTNEASWEEGPGRSFVIVLDSCQAAIKNVSWNQPTSRQYTFCIFAGGWKQHICLRWRTWARSTPYCIQGLIAYLLANSRSLLSGSLPVRWHSTCRLPVKSNIFNVNSLTLSLPVKIGTVRDIPRLPPISSSHHKTTTPWETLLIGIISCHLFFTELYSSSSRPPRSKKSR